MRQIRATLEIKVGFTFVMKPSYLISTLLFITGFAFADGDKAYELLREADQIAKEDAVKASDLYSAAADLYDKALKADPENGNYKQNQEYCFSKSALVLIFQADALAKEEKHSEAAALYKKGIETYESIHKRLGNEKWANNLKYARENGAKAAWASAINSKAAAPGFELPTMDESNSVKLEDLKGKVVLLDFFAGWCGHCTDLAPDLAKLQNDLGDEEFVVVSVSLDRVEGWARNSESKTKQLMEEIKPSHPVLWGDAEVIEAYGEISAVPFVVLIDQEGNLVRDYSDSTKITLKSDIRDLIDG